MVFYSLDQGTYQGAATIAPNRYCLLKKITESVTYSYLFWIYFVSASLWTQSLSYTMSLPTVLLSVGQQALFITHNHVQYSIP